MLLVPREVLFDVMDHAHDISLDESNDASVFQTFCRKATNEYKKSKDMLAFSESMIDFMKNNKHVIRYVGQGSSRIVFAMADGSALKLAKTTAGVAQNKQEAKICMDPQTKYAIFPDFYGVDKQNWLALSCELCSKAEQKDFKEAFMCQPNGIVNIIELIIKMKIANDQFDQLYNYYMNLDNVVYANFVKMLIDDATPAIHAIKSLIEFYRKFGLDELLMGDLEQLDNWGIAIRDKQKTLVVIDAGFSEDIYQRHYKKN